MLKSLSAEPGAVLWLGPSDGQQVLLAHDMAHTGATSWLGQLQLADEVNLGIIDRPGYAITDSASTAGWTADTRMLLDLLDRHGPCHLVAHGYATAGVLLAAQLAPSLVQSVVLVEPPLFQLVQGSSMIEELAGALAELHDQAHDLTAEQFLREYQVTLGYLEPPALTVPDRCAEAARSEKPACLAPIELDALAAMSLMLTVVVGGRQGARHDPGERTIFGGAVWRTAEVLVEAMNGSLVPVDTAGHDVQRRAGAFNEVLRTHLDKYSGGREHRHIALAN